MTGETFALTLMNIDLYGLHVNFDICWYLNLRRIIEKSCQIRLNPRDLLTLTFEMKIDQSLNSSSYRGLKIENIWGLLLSDCNNSATMQYRSHFCPLKKLSHHLYERQNRVKVSCTLSNKRTPLPYSILEYFLHITLLDESSTSKNSRIFLYHWHFFMNFDP